MADKLKKSFTVKTLTQAKRLIILVIGLTVLIFGGILAIPGIPGPGFLVIIFGLAILGTEFVWAKKLLKRFKHHATNIKNSIFNNSKNRK